MDDWHHRLVKELVQETPAGFKPDAAASLEIAFGQARSAITYVLELCRAHRIPAVGNVSGDDVWFELGGQRVRFTLNRREGHVVAGKPGEDARPVGAAEAGGLGALAREAIDGIVAAWRARPAHEKRPSAPPPDFEEEPTKA
jgi:hypothetical protein